MVVPMVFQLEGNQGGSRYEISHRANNPNVAPELQNDFSPKLQNVALGVYPFAQLEKGATQTVNMKFAVRPDGRVIFSDSKDQVLSDFQYAARAMIEEFTFLHPAKDGKPNWGLLTMEVKFDLTSEQVPVSPSGRRILEELRKTKPAIVQANQVDQKVEALVSHSPIYPSNLLETGQEGKAMIEFYIDEAGVVQLPRVASSSHPSFGYAAAQAVSQWRFKPLTKKGKPAVVRARMPIDFILEKPKQPAESQSAPAPVSPQIH